MTVAQRRVLPVVAVVLAGGAGTRVGLGLPKQLLKIAGRTIIEHTLDALHRSTEIDEILVAMTPAFIDRLDALLGARYPKLLPLVAGGASRNDSTKRAIAALTTRHTECKVLFHDAVRPFLDEQTVTNCVRALDHAVAVDVVIESADTIVIVDDDDFLTDIPDRAMLRRGQTPQGFLLSTIAAAYRCAGADEHAPATDDCSVVLKYLPGTAVKAVRGAEHNMKITHPLDMVIADRLFQLRSVLPPEGARQTAYYEAGLKGKTVVIFGGSYGIGSEIARLARGYGADVFPFSRSDTETDVRDPYGVDQALRGVHHQTGRVDYVVNTAGILTRGPLAEMSVRSIEEQVAVNYLASVYIARAGLPHLRDAKGQLLLFTSSSYTRGRAGYSLYSSSKAAIVNLTQALADEWSDLQVRVNCVNPERTRTPMRIRNFGEEPEESLLAPETVAISAVDVLLSDFTGQVVDVRRTPRHEVGTEVS